MRTQLKDVLFLSVLLLLISVRSQAADLTVDAGGTCTLAEAIDSSNNNLDTGDCVADGIYGNDTIILATDVFLGAALPDITTTITIEGNGHKIDGQRDSTVGSVLTIADTGNLTLNGVTVTGGNTSGYGGGINNDNGGTVTLTDSTITGNSADEDGGGIESYNGGTVILIDSTVNGNLAAGYGGGIDNCSPAGTVSSTMTLINSTISGNMAGYDGGGIYNDNGGTVTLTNSTVSGNSAKYGGGIEASLTTVTLTNSTVSGNSAESWGGGIYAWLTTVTLNNCLISGNSTNATEGKEVYNSNSTVNAAGFNFFGHSGESSAQAFYGFTPGGNDVTATGDGTIPTALDAVLHPLADNGGLTMTHALVTGSPALDMDAACSTGLTTDQRGSPRPLGEGCDVGSFEGSKSKLKAMPWLYLLLKK